MAAARGNSPSHMELMARQMNEMSKRLKDVEGEFEKHVKAQKCSPRWWHDHAGRFENDPVFDEIVRLSNQERLAERPKGRKAKGKYARS
jgi:hypothetical protein